VACSLETSRTPTDSSRWAFALVIAAACCAASDLDEFRVKREQVFAFAQKPVVTRDGDRVTIAFEAKSFCDVTVAVENEDGRIVRHLVSGVLGPNAPKPLQSNARRQRVVWDGKNDQGVYIDEKDRLTIRVSLGLRPRYERPLLWSPYKRYGGMPVLAAAPEGVYVADGKGVEFIRLYDHEGKYVRTVYPFPREKLKEVKGLNWYDFPQGYRLPRKGGLYQHTLLTAGANANSGNHSVSRHAAGATAMAVHGSRLATAYMKLCRIGTDGSSAGFDINGPDTGLVIKSVAGGMDVDVGPASIAFSPDGKTLYLTGYHWRTGSWRKVPGSLHVVYKIDYDKGAKKTVFVGDAHKHGTDNAHFRMATSVATDAKGRVYVSDFLNNRVQVYDAAGTYLKSIAAKMPSKVCVDPKTGEIWVFSYQVIGVPDDLYRQYRHANNTLKHTVTRFSALPDARQLSHESFPFGPGENMGFEAIGHVYHVTIDPWADEPTVWVVGRTHQARGAEFHFSGGYAKADQNLRRWEAGVRLLRKQDGKWKTVSAFGNETVREVVRAAPPRHNLQRLYVNPLTGLLYVAEPDSGPTGKASKVWLVIDPDTGRIRIMPLPFNAMEGAFDLDGHLYLRNTDMVVRYDFTTMREIPWDYGIERERQGNDGGIYGTTTYVKAGLKMPSTSPVCYHQGGFSVSPTGDVIASCAYRYVGISSGHLAGKKDIKQSYAYKPVLFPGRIVSSTSPCIHVWDKTGKIKYEDAVPGSGQVDGVFIDRDDNIYLMHTPSRAIDGTCYFNWMSETLMKVRPQGGRVLSTRGQVPLPPEMRPKRKPDLVGRGGTTWVENAEWFYGGVGFAGFNMRGHGGGCACWFARFKLDYFARSIAPEPHQYRVAVIDSAGNLITHIGKYGNEQDGVPLVQPKRFRKGAGHVSRPGSRRSIGGDEVALVHACFVGTHTDRRIFIADYGNNRIVSVKLDYHATERVHLKDIADDGT